MTDKLYLRCSPARYWVLGLLTVACLVVWGWVCIQRISLQSGNTIGGEQSTADRERSIVRRPRSTVHGGPSLRGVFNQGRLPPRRLSIRDHDGTRGMVRFAGRSDRCWEGSVQGVLACY